jgi:serine/threonine protein kinase
LEEFLEEIKRKNLSFSEGEVLQILESIIIALTYAHEHLEGPILHRDICPKNIMISKTGKVTLIDFGIGQIGNKSNDEFMGKPTNLPKSILKGDGKYTVAIDFYSLGVVAYMILTGRNVRGEADIDIDVIGDDEIRLIVKSMLEFNGEYNSLLAKVEEAQFKHKGNLKKVSKFFRLSRKIQGKLFTK